MRPDSTPPDDSLFPIAPCYTAELDAKALDEIVAVLATVGIDPTKTPAAIERSFGAALLDISKAVRKTGRAI